MLPQKKGTSSQAILIDRVLSFFVLSLINATHHTQKIAKFERSIHTGAAENKYLLTT